MTTPLNLTEGCDEAKRFETAGAAQNAGESFCHDHFEDHARSNVDVAFVEGGWVAVITREGNDFDEYVAATSEGTPLTAYLKGYHAGLASLGITVNPYVRGMEDSDEWLRGYREGYRIDNGEDW